MQPVGVYLDYAATTPVDPRVLEAMLPYFGESFGNPSSIHSWGQAAEAKVEEARSSIAAVMGCAAEEIVFTSCGTESDNLALRGAAFAERARRGATRLLTTPVEHHAVLRTALQLAEHHGFRVELLPVDSDGLADPDDLRTALRDDVAVVSVIYSNNEIGTINPIRELGAICRERGVPFHTDAVQAASQLEVKAHDLHVDLMSIGAHKFYGPKGVGALVVRRGIKLLPHQTGGSQESGLRAGTQNVPLIAGMAEALRLTHEEREHHTRHFQALRDRIISEVSTTIPGARLTGHATQRLPNHASFVFEGVDGNALVAALDMAGFACSSGSACKTGDPEPSEVLTALGLSRSWALGSLRVSVGRRTTWNEIEEFCQALPDVVAKLRAGVTVQA